MHHFFSLWSPYLIIFSQNNMNRVRLPPGRITEAFDTTCLREKLTKSKRGPWLVFVSQDWHEGKWLMSTLEKTLWMLGQVSQSHRKARTWQWFWERIYSFDEYDVPASAGGNFRSACQQIRRFSFYIFSAKGLRYKQYLLYSVNFNFLENESL